MCNTHISASLDQSGMLNLLLPADTMQVLDAHLHVARNPCRESITCCSPVFVSSDRSQSCQITRSIADCGFSSTSIMNFPGTIQELGELVMDCGFEVDKAAHTLFPEMPKSLPSLIKFLANKDTDMCYNRIAQDASATQAS